MWYMYKDKPKAANVDGTAPKVLKQRICPKENLGEPSHCPPEEVECPRNTNEQAVHAVPHSGIRDILTYLYICNIHYGHLLSYGLYGHMHIMVIMDMMNIIEKKSNVLRILTSLI